MEWKWSEEKCTKKVHLPNSKTKNLVMTFFDIHGIIPKHRVPRGQTVKCYEQHWSAENSCSEPLQQKRPELWKANNWLLHHDNAPAQLFSLPSNDYPEAPAYSLDLDPNDLFLYMKIKEVLRGVYFAGEEVMKEACDGVLKHVPEEAFQSWLYTYRFSRFDMFVHYFVNYFVRLRTNQYRLLTISPILFIFDSVRNLTRNFPYLLFDVLWKYWLSGENGDARWEKWLARWFTKCHLYTYRFSHFANIFSHSRQFDDKCIAGSGVFKLMKSSNGEMCMGRRGEYWKM